MWTKKEGWKRYPMKKMFGQCPKMGMEESFTMIEAQGRLFLYNKRNGDV